MAYKLTPPAFRREVERRLLDVKGVQALLKKQNRQAVWWMVESGKLPPPLLLHERSYALWDADEIESFNRDKDDATKK